MSRIRVYIKPFETTGVYADFIEVTSDVDANSITSVKREIDSTTYAAGIFKFSNVVLRLANERGLYSDIDVFQSIFRHKRTDSIVKITWAPNPSDDQISGSHTLGPDVTIFEGLLNDEATTLEVKSQKISFQCFGFESQFNRMITPFGSLSIGNTYEDIIYACLNQAPFNNLVTVDLANINLGTNVATDAIANLENKTVKEALNTLLIESNSVLYIEDNIVYVVDRSPSAALKYTFYGQAAEDGIENIQNITSVRRGVNRVFNLITWKDSTEASSDGSSQSIYGVRKKEVDSDLITDTGKRSTVLTAIKDEFKDPKQEFSLTSGFNYTRFGLTILDKVKVDYPTVFVSADNDALPLWGTSRWGDFLWPIGQWSITISVTDNYKILGVIYNFKSGTITHKLREI